MGLYNERAGCVSFATRTAAAAAAIKSQLALIVRHMYSNPPAHGAQVANLIMGEPAAFASWRKELAQVCGRIKKMREMLHAELKEQGVPGNWDHVT